MIKKVLACFILPFLITPVFSQQEVKSVEWLPEEHYFAPLILDPTESQSFGALYAYHEGGEWRDIIYAPLALGFQLPVVNWDKGDYGFEIGFLTTVFFQFEFIEPAGMFRVNLINTDFKAGIPFTFRKGHFSLRTSLYHVSSHFSEEYIFRNGLEGFSENLNTYEALDVHASWHLKHMRYYAGLGYVLNSPWGREPLKVQAGLMFRTAIRPGSKFNYIAGLDLQLLQETAWSLNTHLGAGIEIAYRKSRTFQIMLQYYTGNIPYSQYTHLKVQYVGAALVGHPF